MATIKQTLKYPFVKFARLWNYWWWLVPIWGWLVVGGYVVRIAEELRKGKNEELPAIRPFTGLFSTGFFLLIALLVPLLATAFLARASSWLLIVFIYIVLISPLLVFQFSEKRKVKDGMNIFRATRLVFSHLGSFLVTWLKMIVVMIIWSLASLPVITLLITLPALRFGGFRLFADFYAEAVERQQKKSNVKRRKEIEKDIGISIQFRKKPTKK